MRVEAVGGVVDRPPVAEARVAALVVAGVLRRVGARLVLPGMAVRDLAVQQSGTRQDT